MKLKRLKYSALFPNTHVFGFEELMDNLNIEIEKIEGRTLGGLIEGAAIIRRDTEKSVPLTPVDLGNLRSSWFVVTAKGKEPDDDYNKGFRTIKSEKLQKSMKFLSGDAARFAKDRANAIAEKTGEARMASYAGVQMLIMGYSANYAVYVHENMGTSGNKKKGDRNSRGWSRPGSDAKWFQYSVQRNKDKILDAIRKRAMIP